MTKLGITICLDGGWGVDALLEKQSRPHSDLDITIQQKDVQRAREFLEEHGYKDVPRGDTTYFNFVLGDDKGHQVDFHVIVFDKNGNGIYGPKEKGIMYPAASLKGTGVIDGHEVKCISPEYMIKFHTGYTLREVDFIDVRALCKKFKLDPPQEYR